mgnify:CR=1 FL=1
MIRVVYFLFSLLLFFGCESPKYNYEDVTQKTYNQLFSSLDLSNNKTYVINFWATWCSPCVRELPSLNNLNNIFLENDDFVLIAINIGQDKAVVRKFIDEKTRVDFIVLLDEKMELSNWNVQAIPTTFLVDKNGKVLYKAEGEKAWDDPKFITFFNSFIEK